MILLDLQQGSPAWLDARKNYFTASQASAMMGFSPYTSRNDLLKQIKTGIEPEVDAQTQRIFDRGHEVEALARPIAEAIIDESLYPVTALDDNESLLASFDGVTLMEDIIWENKQWNESKASDVLAGNVPECDYWQVVQQLYVSKADKCLYMVTDGTEANTVHIWVFPNEDDFERLIAGWAQFEEDLKSYEVEIPKQTVIGATQEELPALTVDLVGEVRSSNLATFEDVVLNRIRSVNTELVTDQHFADAEATVKFFTKGEKQLEELKDRALSQTATIDQLFKTVDRLKEEMRSKRLQLNKLVKDRKEQMRTELVMNAKKALNNFISDLVADLNGFSISPLDVDFGKAIKGKKTIDSMKSSVDDMLASSKIDATQAVVALKKNIQTLDEMTTGYEQLFRDRQHLAAAYRNEHLIAEIKSRLIDFKELQERRAKQEAEHSQRLAESAVKADDKIKQATIEREPARPTPIHPHECIDVDDTVVIPRAEYEQLLNDQRVLHALKAAGVDNWEGFDIAMSAA